MNWELMLWTTGGVLLTLATFSFLYRDNPFYKIAEHLFVGVSVGYFTIILWYNGLVPTLIDRLWIGDSPVPWYSIWDPEWWDFNIIGIFRNKWWYLIPATLGVLMWFRFSKKKNWISRYPIAFYLGIATGVAIPVEMQNRVNRQIADTLFAPSFAGGFWSGIGEIVIIIGVFSGLFYFFFSVPHRGAFGGVAKTGIHILMIGFGASFGYTVMGRISLFIQRVQYIRDWVDNSLSGTGGQQSLAVIIILIIVLIVILEIIRQMRKRATEVPQ